MKYKVLKGSKSKTNMEAVEAALQDSQVVITVTQVGAMGAAVHGKMDKNMGGVNTHITFYATKEGYDKLQPVLEKNMYEWKVRDGAIFTNQDGGSYHKMMRFHNTVTLKQIQEALDAI